MVLDQIICIPKNICWIYEAKTEVVAEFSFSGLFLLYFNQKRPVDINGSSSAIDQIKRTSIVNNFSKSLYRTIYLCNFLPQNMALICTLMVHKFSDIPEIYRAGI